MSETETFTAEELRKALDPNESGEISRLPDFGGRIPKEITPPNFLKQKVGSGGLDAKIIEKAQKLVEKNAVDFKGQAQDYLNSIEATIHLIETRSEEYEEKDLVNMMIHPAMQLKANGGMFKYDLVTNIADLFVRFLEGVKTLDQASLEMINGFYTSLKAIIYSEIKGDGGKDGQELLAELKAAWQRYLEKRKKN